MMPAQQNDSLAPVKYLLEGIADVSSDIGVAGLSVDARTIERDGLFLAVAGSQSHGLAYAEQAIDAGAIAIAYEPTKGGDFLAKKLEKKNKVYLIEVPGLSLQLSEIASRFYQRPSAKFPVIGVTGTNGKTSVSHFIAQALNDASRACGVIGTLGWGDVDSLKESINTTPDAVSVQQQLTRLLDDGLAAVAMEVSSHGLDQGRVNAVEFKGAVFTNLSHDHLDYHQTMDAYGQAKLELFRCPSLEFAVLNRDDSFHETIIQTLLPNVNVFTFSRSSNYLEDESCLVISGEELTATGLSFDVSMKGCTANIQSGLFGRFNTENIAATILSLIAMGDTLEQAANKVKQIKNVAGRMQLVSTKESQPTVIVDYAHTPDALKLALLSLREHCKGKLKLVFGCGGDRDEAKRPLMGAIAADLADEVVITNDNPRFESAEEIAQQIKAGVRNINAVSVILDREQAILKTVAEANNSDVILVAGKGHEEYQQIGDRKTPFSDVAQVRCALNLRAGEDGCKS